MLYLNKRQADELIEHAKREAPNEACGLLAGAFGTAEADVREVKKVYQMANTDKSAASFFMDPKEQLKVMKEIRNAGLDMIGIYHSHPQTQAYPSAHDIELAYYPEVSYVIISLRDRQKPILRAFRIEEGKVREEEIKIGE